MNNDPASPESRFDFIIVGGGSAGCVLAARLSENPSQRVALIEAGSDLGLEGEPRYIRDPRCRALFAPETLWPGLAVEGVAKSTSPFAPASSPLQQARVLGGGSAINGMHAQRGEEADYEEWRQLGVTGWSWEELIPFFKKLETDLDFTGPLHGSDGPIQVKRNGQETWSALSLALLKVFERRGLSYVDDVNVRGGDGIAPVPLSASDQRSHTASAYLTSQVRSRQNLTILANRLVKRLLFTDRRVTGVELFEPCGTTILGSNVILSAGALQTPAILQRSGVGPAEVLQSANIPAVAIRQGVGRRLQSHPFITPLFARLSPRARNTGRALAPCLAVVRYSSGQGGCPPADMLINLWERIPGPLAGDRLLRQFADFMLLLNKSYSEGAVSLNSADPFGSPQIRFNLLGDSRDYERMMSGVRMVLDLTRSAEFDGLITDRISLLHNPLVGALMSDTLQARVLSEIGGIAMDSLSPLRPHFLKMATVPIDSLTASEKDLERYVVTHINAGGHPTGTCRMGDRNQDGTVVDSRCRLLGVDGVRVSDASIFPTPLRAGTNIPTIMAAEKVASMIAEDARGSR